MQKLLKKKDIQIAAYEDKITDLNREVEALKTNLEVCTSTFNDM